MEHMTKVLRLTSIRCQSDLQSTLGITFFYYFEEPGLLYMHFSYIWSVKVEMIKRKSLNDQMEDLKF